MCTSDVVARYHGSYYQLFIMVVAEAVNIGSYTARVCVPFVIGNRRNACCVNNNNKNFCYYYEAATFTTAI